MLGENDLPIHDPNDPLGQPIPVITPATPQAANPLAISIIAHEDKLNVFGTDITTIKNTVFAYDDAAAEAAEKTQYGTQIMKGTTYALPSLPAPGNPFFITSNTNAIYMNSSVISNSANLASSFSLGDWGNGKLISSIFYSSKTLFSQYANKPVILVMVSNNAAIHINLGNCGNNTYEMVSTVESWNEVKRLGEIHNSLAKECKFRVYIRTV